MCLFLRKKTFKMLGLTFSSKLDWGSYIVSIAKTASKKIGALIRCMKFHSPEVALYLYKSTIQSYMEYCCHFWAGGPSCYWNCWISCRNGYVGLLVFHLLPLLNHWLIAVGSSLEPLAQWLMERWPSG